MAAPYGYAWQRARLVFLREHPLCVMCADAGRVTSADVVDHRVPHKGDPHLFWDWSNWQSLCKRCHDSHKQSQEKGGRPRPTVGVDGKPRGWR
jgi:5-methylcytosine-specific restriction endonuclease McrA